MILYEKTLIELSIDCLKLKPQSVKKVYWQCDKCNLERLKPYRDCINNSGLCFKCNSIKNATAMGNKFGKTQKMQGKCLYCETEIRSQHVTCKKHRKEHLTKIRSGSNNPAWKGTNECRCGQKKSTGARMCRNCSFISGERSGSNNGRWVKDRGHILSAKIARTLLSNTLKTLGIKKNGITIKLLGYTFNDLKHHLESKFEPWMNWGNRGIAKNKWSIDHIIPVSVLIKNGINDPKVINALWNLRPLKTETNIKRSNTVDKDAIDLAKLKLNLDI
jgi:hypothetical protein